MNYLSEAKSDGMACEGQIRRSTLTERLRANKQHHETQLAQINTVLEALEKNPELQDVIDKVYSLGM